MNNYIGCLKDKLLVCTAAVAFLSAAQFLYAKDARTIRVGYYPLADFQEYNEENDQYRGYSYDFMLAIAQYAGWKYDFVKVDYAEGVKMLEAGTLDLMNNIPVTDELSHHLSYSSLSSGESWTCLVTSPENTNVSFEDFKSIAELAVGLDYSSSRNSGFIDYCKDNDCMPRLTYYHTAENVNSGMSAGEINAYLVSNLQNVNMHTVAKFNTQSYYFAVPKGSLDILQELNTAMNALHTDNPYFSETLYAKYHGKSAEQQTIISEYEKEYIKSAPVIKVVYNPEWYPLSYKSGKGKFSGAMADIFNLISARTGLNFDYISAASETEMLLNMTNGKTQIIAGIPYDYTWAEKINVRLTPPVMLMTMFTAYKTGNHKNSTLAIPKDSYLGYLTKQIQRENVSIADYSSTEECLTAVLKEHADYTFLDSYQLEYYKEKAKYRNLSFKVANSSEFSLALGVSNDSDDRLYSIIRKTLFSLGTDEISSILKNTSITVDTHSLLDILYANPQAAGIFFSLAGFMAAILIFGAIYARRISRKNEELKKATNAKSAFMSNISHDMRTPLNGIIGYTNLAKKADNEEKKNDYLNKIDISGHLLLDLINDTLDISKIENGKYVLNPEITDSTELLDSIIVPIRQSAENKNIHFTLNTDEMRKGYIKIDRLNMQKVILNLLSNAVKFTPEGGSVNLTIKTLKPSVNGINTRITVSDTGIGISEDFLPKLYQPFMQEHAPEAGGIVGTGLGLSIVKKVVSLMGGSVSVNSSKGHGTTFEVLLPIQFIENYKPAAAGSKTDGNALKNLSVLLCEDNSMNSEIAVTILESFGMKVTWAKNGRQGVDIFKSSAENSFDVILMDLRMPVLNGYEATSQIRGLNRTDAQTVPIIAMSADAYDEDIRRTESCGMDGHIAKPFNPEVLKNILITLCDKTEDKNV